MWPGPGPASMPSFILIHPTVWPQYTNVTDRTRQTDRQWSGSVGELFYKWSPNNNSTRVMLTVMLMVVVVVVDVMTVTLPTMMALMVMFILLPHGQSLDCSFDQCRLSNKPRPGQPTWGVNLLAGCHCPHLPSRKVIIYPT